jgi:hypothetical protein
MVIEITEKTPKIWIVVIILAVVLSGVISIIILISNLTALNALYNLQNISAKSFMIFSQEIDKSDCMWTTCNGQDIQWCGNYNLYLTAEHCCNGCPCSDTYYDSSDDTCHLSLCENTPFTENKDCVYQGNGWK